MNSPEKLINDVTAIGLEEPQAYVRDYFVGDGFSQRFYLSQTPFQQSRTALIDEEYVGPALDPTVWNVADPTSAISVSAQTLQVQGGAGQDGKTTVSFLEQIELGGAIELQHGDVSFSGPSQGVIGGLYAGTIATANCVAGFQITESGQQSNIQAVVNGEATGAAVGTTIGHRYLFTTYIYSREVFRSEQMFHSSVHPAGNGLGGGAILADVRLVLCVQDIDPSNPASSVAPATVLFDDVVENAPGFCTYALVNSMSLQCSIAYTYGGHISTAEVRTALQNSNYTTALVESPAEGGQCAIVSSTTLDFYPQYVPALNTLIVASYRGMGRAVAEVANGAGIAALANGSDNGVRGMVRTVKIPSARTQADCENAALAVLDDAATAAWSGTYKTWSDFLPGGAGDLFPGDGVSVNCASRAASFNAIVRKVTIDWADPSDDRGVYTIEFANDFSSPVAIQEEASATAVSISALPVRLATEQVGAYYLANVSDAQITQINSTTVQVDAGAEPGNGGGVEIRMHDFGWGPANDRNLIGRFTTQTFSLTRLARTQNYFLRLYDGSTPPRYSRYSAVLHVDYPL